MTDDAILSALVAAIAALTIGLVRVRERLARVEQRLTDLLNGHAKS